LQQQQQQQQQQEHHRWEAQGSQCLTFIVERGTQEIHLLQLFKLTKLFKCNLLNFLLCTRVLFVAHCKQEVPVLFTFPFMFAFYAYLNPLTAKGAIVRSVVRDLERRVLRWNSGTRAAKNIRHAHTHADNHARAHQLTGQIRPF